MKRIQWRGHLGLGIACIAMTTCAIPATMFAASKPVANSCAASPASVYPGDPVTVTCSALNLNRKKKHITFSWSATGGSVSGTLATATVNTAGLAAGTYTVTENISEGKKLTQSADANASFAVKDFDPPSVACSASPTSVQAGTAVTILAHGSSPQHRSLRYSFVASSGQIASKGNRAMLDTEGIAPGFVTVSCNVTDDQGHKGTTVTAIVVNSPPPPPVPKTVALCVIPFPMEPGSRVLFGKDAKTCLDIVAVNLQRHSDAEAVLVMSTASESRNGKKRVTERAVLARNYLVEQKKIDSSRIDLRTSTAPGPAMQSYLVPADASFDTDQPGTTELDLNLIPTQKTHRAKASR